MFLYAFTWHSQSFRKLQLLKVLYIVVKFPVKEFDLRKPVTHEKKIDSHKIYC